MTSDENLLSRPVEPPRSSFQFSLRTLLIGVTAVAVLCSLLVASPPWVGLLTTIFLVTAVPAALTTMIIYSQSYGRTFAIGAMFLAGVPLWHFGLPWLFNSPAYYNSPGAGTTMAIGVAVALVFIVAAGLIAVGVRWMCEQAERTPDPKRPDSTAG